MSMTRIVWLAVLTLFATVTVAGTASAQQQQKPNILFIMGDDIGWMQPSIYHQGLMVGETPNIDRIGQEGAKFTDYYAEQSCTAGRSTFITGQSTLRTVFQKWACRPPQWVFRRETRQSPNCSSQLAMRPASSAKIILAIETNICRPCMASTNSMAISTI